MDHSIATFRDARQVTKAARCSHDSGVLRNSSLRQQRPFESSTTPQDSDIVEWHQLQRRVRYTDKLSRTNDAICVEETIKKVLGTASGSQ